MDRPKFRVTHSVALAVALSASIASSARADFNFNPTGGASTPTYSINGLGFGGGNALAQGSIPLSVGKTFQLYFQTHLTSLTGPNAPAAVPGLNSTFQITEVAVLTEMVTSITTTSNGTTAQFALATSGPNSMSIYYNNAVTFNDAQGTGFTDGIKIMNLTTSSFTDSSFTDATQGGGKPQVKFNQTSAGNAPNALADQGGGNSDVNFNVGNYNPAFFQPPLGQPALVSSIESLNVKSFFDSLSPSLKFNDPTLPANSAPTITPNIGAVNGMGTNNDFQLQVSGFTQSFTAVPEPASIAMTLVGFGVVGLGSRLARRRRTAA